jgi:HD-GYP domain-containing protein (c-di-GMP phosphodiesterase class II)
MQKCLQDDGMEKTIKVNELKVGMYVILSLSWYKHPFINNEFTVTAQSQIDKIIESNIREILIDTEKSHVVENEVPAAGASVATETEPRKSIIPDELKEAVYDKKLPPQEKAKAVQKHSTTMIINLLENPTAENIKEAKKGIAEVVDLILTDDETSYYLLSITSHDYYTYTHSVNVGFHAVALSKALFRKSSSHNMHELGAGFFLHDLGKVRIDLAILNKPDKLTDDEMNEMRKHPNLGFNILNETHQLTEECRTIVLQHHERNDGKGYPKGMLGDEIHIYGKICSIADVFDALTSDRPYRRTLQTFEALKLMREQMIDHFQKDLFEQFVLLFR